MQTLFNQKGPTGKAINGYFRIQDIWDETELDWTDIKEAQRHKWITTTTQARDYKKLITTIKECRPEWELILKTAEPMPEVGSIQASVATDPDDKIVIDDLFKVTDTFSITNLVQLQPLTLKEDGSLVETEKAPKTILPLQDIAKCNTVEIKNKMKNKTMLQALTSETDSLFDKTSWGAGDTKFTMMQFTVKSMRTLISSKKAKPVNSLEHWNQRLCDTTIDWGSMWKTLSHHWIDKKSASIVLKMVHLVKRPQYAIRPHQCPNRCCRQIHNADYVHACFTCPTAQSVWQHTVKMWVKTGHHPYKQFTSKNLILGLPKLERGCPSPAAPLAWVVFHTTTVRCLWTSWCSHVHEGSTYEKKYLINKVTNALTERLEVLWKRSIRRDIENSIGKSSIDDKAKTEFLNHWCSNNSVIEHNSDTQKVKVDLSKEVKTTGPESRPTTRATSSGPSTSGQFVNTSTLNGQAWNCT